MENRPDLTRRWNRGGVNRVVAVLLALIAVMLVVIAIPIWQRYRERSEIIACEQAMKSARDGLIIEYLNRNEESTIQEAMATLDQVMVARPNICPSGGEVYLIKNEQGIYEPLCGLHDSDTKRRVRLNASRAQELLAEGRRAALREYGAEPEAVELNLNGQPLTCQRVDAVAPLRWGTAASTDYEGIVCLYGVAGTGDFPATDDTPEGEVCYFLYADENHCARWLADDGWTGDAYWG